MASNLSMVIVGAGILVLLFASNISYKQDWVDDYDIRSEHMDDGKNSRFSEWGPDAAVEMRNKVRDFELPFVKGGTVGNILNKTPASNISKVVLEGKHFETWFWGRTVLIGNVPTKRIHYNKRIQSTAQDEIEVVIKCSVNTSYEGRILIGTDGAYSTVRQNMCKEIEKK
ncbi:hypothetical protein BG000_007354 [Podila horticola]|nr:hypothetical protein BG000_007354 [Podila horticola]